MEKIEFPGTGLAYFWFLNDECDDARVASQIERFGEGGVTAVCLHARFGLLRPYGGKDWLAFIRRTAEACAAAGVGVWLYDEMDCPSGNAGGRIIMDRPELMAHGIQCDEADPALKEGELFCFPRGKLIWAGCVPVLDSSMQPIDLTDHVGVVKREYEIREQWDSRWYYPATPLYPCPRFMANNPELCMRVPAVPDGMKLVAFVARSAGEDSTFGGMVDSLNPAATKVFIEGTYDAYYDALGDMFGKEIPAIFTDEPKYFDYRPWTPGLFEAFEAAYGYDLRARLYHLFSDSESPAAMLTRLHYREWCGRRFEEVWLNPVRRWCDEHGVKLVGHISPEDDPVQQAACVSNLFPLQKYFELAGLDLIIPAVGDADHPMINVGIVSAVSSAQQEEQPGVMSESLGASGLDMTAEEASRIIHWQTVMGLTTPVIHAAFLSTEMPRLYDAPPDFGPDSPRWEGMCRLGEELRPVQDMLLGATQIAPVAILWPIRSFQARNCVWQAEPGGERRDLLELLLACLERQVGVHFVDEDSLIDARVDGDGVHVGRATYQTILLPSCTVLKAATVERLKALSEGSVAVRCAGDVPRYSQAEGAVNDLDLSWCERGAVADVVDALPSLVTVDGCDARLIRCTSWRKGDDVYSLVMNIGKKDVSGRIDGVQTELPAGSLRIITHCPQNA